MICTRAHFIASRSINICFEPARSHYSQTALYTLATERVKSLCVHFVTVCTPRNLRLAIHFQVCPFVHYALRLFVCLLISLLYKGVQISVHFILLFTYALIQIDALDLYLPNTC